MHAIWNASSTVYTIITEFIGETHMPQRKRSHTRIFIHALHILHTCINEPVPNWLTATLFMNKMWELRSRIWMVHIWFLEYSTHHSHMNSIRQVVWGTLTCFSLSRLVSSLLRSFALLLQCSFHLSAQYFRKFRFISQCTWNLRELEWKNGLGWYCIEFGIITVFAYYKIYYLIIWRDIIAHMTQLTRSNFRISFLLE